MNNKYNKVNSSNFTKELASRRSTGCRNVAAGCIWRRGKVSESEREEEGEEPQKDTLNPGQTQREASCIKQSGSSSSRFVDDMGSVKTFALAAVIFAVTIHTCEEIHF